jgi:hypothetical protein
LAGVGEKVGLVVDKAATALDKASVASTISFTSENELLLVGVASSVCFSLLVTVTSAISGVSDGEAAVVEGISVFVTAFGVEISAGDGGLKTFSTTAAEKSGVRALSDDSPRFRLVHSSAKDVAETAGGDGDEG